MAGASQSVPERLRASAWVAVALLAFLAGLIVGAFGGSSRGGSRAGWPPATTNPRSLSP